MGDTCGQPSVSVATFYVWGYAQLVEMSKLREILHSLHALAQLTCLAGKTLAPLTPAQIQQLCATFGARW